MRRIIMDNRYLLPVLLAAVIVTLGCSGTQPAQEEGSVEGTSSATVQEPARIAVSDLKQKLESGEKFLLIDVREDWELEADGAIEGAIHIPVAELDARMPDIPKDVELVFY
jgi:hypothetical protein